MRIGIFSLIAWDFIHQRPHKFAEELAALGHEIVYIEPPDLTGGRQALLRQALRVTARPRPVAAGIGTIRPVVIPPFRAYAHLLPLNRVLQPLATRLIRQLRLDFAIVLATEYGPVVRALDIPFAYDHVDDTQFMEHVLTERFVADMDDLRREGAFTIYIQEAEARRDPKGVFAPNGADLDQFRRLEVERLFDAVVLSNIAKWFDMDAILGSKKRILLIGPMDVDGGDNRARFFAAERPNLLWIPQVDKQVANLWLSRAEVGLVPFRHTHPVLRYAMPIKILEYFLAGLPVVTYRNEGIQEMYGDMVSYFASDGTDQSLDEAIDEAKSKRGRDYRAFAARFQWRDIIAGLERHILQATGVATRPATREAAPCPIEPEAAGGPCRDPRCRVICRKQPPPLPREAVAALAAPPARAPAPSDLQIVYLALTDWHFLRQRPQHLAQELSRRYPLLYVRPVPLSRLVRTRGRALPPEVEAVDEHLTLLRPRALSPGRLAAIARANDERLIALVQRHLQPDRRTVLWLSHPDQASLIGHFGETLVCFDSLDYHAAFKRGAAMASMAAAELDITRRADLVFTSSDDLQARALAAGADARLVPNAAEFERFATAATTPLAAPPEILPLPRPRLLFYGTLGPWVDTDLLAAVARRRPDWTILLLGTNAGADPRPLAGLRNVHLLGWRPYETLPAYLQHADVCLLPFARGDLTAAVDPVKLYEYLAAGRPVVSTPLAELAKWGDLVAVAATPEATVAAVERAMNAPESAERRLARLAVAARHTWRARGAAVAEAIEERLAAAGSGAGLGGSAAGTDTTLAVADPVP